ncbi:MAG TPA: sigma-70 family RNA polymerase sigma factor [Candidatus Limnocylindrales bacterium]|nr:sigma-70 family RNA polymerase sigma factor [Candidatus Limnocylindrales bacterium]
MTALQAPPIELRHLLRAAPGGGVLSPAVIRDADTFEAVYRDHYRDVERYVLLMLGRPDDADDVVADTFQRAFAAWRSGHGPAGRALPWLLLIARRIVTDRWRRSKLIRWLPIGGPAAPEPAGPDSTTDRTEFWLWLGELARVLPERQREVIYLRYQRDLTDGEIGDILGLSASGVRSLAGRAIAALRTHPELWS